MLRQLSCFAIASLATGCFISRDVPPGIGVSTLVATQYNHRGMVMDDRGVFQVGVDVDLPVEYGSQSARREGTLTLSTLGNMGLTDSAGRGWLPDNQGGKFSEVDLSAKYSERIGPVDLTAGLLAYVFPNGSQFPNGVRGSTTEMFLRAGGTVFENEIYSFYPNIVLHYDADEVDGTYISFGVNKAMPLPQIAENLSLEVDLQAGFSDTNHSEWTYGVSDPGLADLRFLAGLAYFVPDWRTTFTLGLGVSTIIDSRIRDWFEIIDIDADNVWGTLGMSWNF